MLKPAFDIIFEAGKIATRIGGVNDRTPPLVNLDSDVVPDQWLATANKRYRAESLPAKRRPLEALCDYTKEKNAAIRFGSPAAERVFHWFKERSAPEGHQIGALFNGSYFYDAHFWPVSIPIGYGNVRLDAFQSLDTMPDAVKIELSNDAEELRTYVLHRIDCVDYAYGYDDIRKFGKLKPRALALLKNADHELRGAVDLVSDLRPNPRAAFSARMATELFLKALLVEKADYSDADLKSLSHNLDKLCQEVQKVCEATEITTVRRLVSLFPPINERYFGDDLQPAAVGNTLSTCQMAATTVIRQFTDRDSRSQVFEVAAQQT
jgi:HEPN domain-containing protein